MKNKHMMVALVAGSLTLGTSLKGAGPPDAPPAPPPPGQAQPPAQPRPPGQLQPDRNNQEPQRAEMAPEHSCASSCMSVTHIIGREVRNDVGEHLGTVQDLIVSLDSDAARFAVIKYGGTLGIGGTRVAVPLKDLKWSGDTKQFSMAASKEQIQSASSTPTGGWAFAANQDWAGKINRFYGDPGKTDLSQLARPGSNEPGDSREFVRDLAPPEPAIGPENQLPAADLGAMMPLSNSTDADILAKVNELIGQDAGPATGSDVQAAVDKGVVTLTGKVASALQKQLLEPRIKSLSGVVALNDDQLVATNE